ncbi:lactate utilization protein [Mobilitalea sibirica]|uniref:Lactate utilization protein n=1 Tax=Mobilitalea sibirica TaxID=1462919 RepID=A0A8J7HEA8_9FIRM|nr:lactate utilization protein [Mobilitalea sibirica]MBH1941824.1 lactate utilization protein [Mobilitalea sibirica]
MDIIKVIETLKHKGYTVSYFENKEDAAVYLNNIIDNKSVGFGDSATLLGMKLFERLSSHNEIFDPQHCPIGMNFIDTAKKSLTTKVFLTSVNALSETGEIVNIDGTGNRVAGALFGHEKVYFVTGSNKIVPTLEDAIWRARNIVAPQNAMRLQLRTPCAKKGERCYDCSSPDRICNGMMIHFKKMNDIDMEIVLINERLGF